MQKSGLENSAMVLRTPFQDFDKYSSPLGFGRKTSPAKDPHTIEMSSQLDTAIKTVAK